MDSKYKQLYPPPLVEPEYCTCTNAPIKLMHALGYNPIHCMNCNLEIRPDTLSLTESQIETIVDWRCIYDAIYHLWLSSGDYEKWAFEQLLDTSSSVNLAGLEICNDLRNISSCFYWHFQGEMDSPKASFCPVCKQDLEVYEPGSFQQKICPRCFLVFS